MDPVICETRYCPGCGIEIRCESMDGAKFNYLISDQPEVCCPECGRDFLYENLHHSPQNRKGAVKTTVSKNPSIDKAGLIEDLYEKNDIFHSKAESERALNSVGKALFSNLTQGKNVIWSDLGRFKVVTQKARKGRNPQTGEEIDIPARVSVKFSPSKKLKDALNE